MISTWLQIVLSFSKIGITALGGGNSILKLLEYEAVTYRHWVGPEEFVSMVGASFLFPGLTVVKLSALIGYKSGGFLGLLLAVLCLNLPGLVTVVLGYNWLLSHDGPHTRKLMSIVQYGALALLGAALFTMIQGVLNLSYSIMLIGSSFLFFLCLVFGGVSPFYGFVIFIALCFFLIPL